jgi:hypothetical protein
MKNCGGSDCGILYSVPLLPSIYNGLLLLHVISDSQLTHLRKTSFLLARMLAKP